MAFTSSNGTSVKDLSCRGIVEKGLPGLRGVFKLDVQSRTALPHLGHFPGHLLHGHGLGRFSGQLPLGHGLWAGHFSGFL